MGRRIQLVSERNKALAGDTGRNAVTPDAGQNYTPDSWNARTFPMLWFRMLDIQKKRIVHIKWRGGQWLETRFVGVKSKNGKTARVALLCKHVVYSSLLREIAV